MSKVTGEHPLLDSARVPVSRRAVESLLTAADRLRRTFAELTGPHGITFQQYNVLRILRGAGPDGLPTMEVRKRMIEQAPGITGLIDRLESKGLVARLPTPRDRRETICRVSRKGLALLEKLDRAMDEADVVAFESLSGAKLETLAGLLGELARERR